MSLVLEKVGKVLSCEIRAQAKGRLHVSHFKFIKTTFVLLTYSFPSSEKAYGFLAPTSPHPPLHTIPERRTLRGTDAKYTATTIQGKRILEHLERLLKGRPPPPQKRDQ